MQSIVSMPTGTPVFISEIPSATQKFPALRTTNPRHDKARIEEGKDGLMTFTSDVPLKMLAISFYLIESCFQILTLLLTSVQ